MTRPGCLFWIATGVLLALIGIVVWIATTDKSEPRDESAEHTDASPASIRTPPLSTSSDLEENARTDPVPATAVREAVTVLAGTVRWPEGQPGGGAEVVVTKASDRAMADGEKVWIDHVEADGSFRLDGLSEGNYLLVVRSIRRESPDSPVTLGWWIASTRFRMPRAEPVDLVLGPGESIHGRVSPPRGWSLDGFEIQVAPKYGEGALNDGRAPFDWNFGSSDGRFELVGLLPGAWEVTVDAGGFAPVRPRTIEVPRSEPVDFDLAGTVELNGRVVDPSGEHLRSVVRAKWSESGDSIGGGSASDHTMGDGLFRVRVPPTQVELRATFDGVDSEPMELDLSRGGARDGLILIVPGKQ